MIRFLIKDVLEKFPLSKKLKYVQQNKLNADLAIFY